MKFAEHLSAHITPEWRKQYILYEEMKNILYNAVERQPSSEVADKDEVIRYIRAFDEEFFSFCEKELAKINTFFAEKLAEAQRKFANLKTELDFTKAKTNQLNQRQNVKTPSNSPSTLSPTKSGERKFTLTNAASDINLFRNIFDNNLVNKAKERKQTRKMHEIKLGFSEFYLSLVLLQNYQNLNFTGFRKILKKHDKLMNNDTGLKWRTTHVEVATFYMNKDIGKLIEDTEGLFTNDLEEGDRQKAMKRLRVPPLNDHQSRWTTFKVGFFSGCFVILILIVVISIILKTTDNKDNFNLRIMFRLYRSPFLIILFIFLMAINVYGWRTSGVNHVLIFELDPRDHLSEQHIVEIASVFSVLWSISVIGFMFSEQLSIPAFTNPLALIIIMLVFLFNPAPVLMHTSRFWLLRVFYKVFTAPIYKVTFADFWLADQFNSLVPVFADIQYISCFYLSIDSFKSSNFTEVNEKCISDNMTDLMLRTIMSCLPAWIRMVQCLRRYYDDNKGPFPHLVNAGKYSTTLFVVFFSAMVKYYSPYYSSSTSNPFFYCWIIALVISSCYTYSWDVMVDWGLFSSDSPKETPFLREEIVYSSPYYYYFAIVQDLILRFGWTMSISLTELGIANSDLMLSILAPLEIYRRFVWNFFRLENEHLNNCGEFRAVRDISIAPLDAGDQAKIIKMMDHPNGVTNRKLSCRKTLNTAKNKFINVT